MYQSGLPISPGRDRRSGGSGIGHSSTARRAASTASVASTSVLVSGMPRARHSHQKVRGPAGGKGHIQQKWR